ncbi:MAG: response regulator [Nitrosotalea sp.]
MTGIQQNKSILLVEEDHTTALSIKLQLETNGFKVELFTDPVLALDEYKKSPLSYDLVISDIKTVHMSTFEFMRAIRLENSNSRILLITPFEIKASEFSKVLPENKVNGFVEKPLLLTRLVSSVKEILALPNNAGFKL